MTTQKKSVLLAAALLLCLSACGPMKTNPTEDYPDLADSTAPHGQVARAQSVLDSAMLQIENDPDHTMIFNFVEGEAGTKIVTPSSRIDGLNFRLVAKDLPEGACFGPVNAAEPMGAYALTWSPRVGTIAVLDDSIAKSGTIEVVAAEGSDPASVARLNQINVPRSISVVLNKTREIPTVESVSVETPLITLGESTRVSVIVKDIGASADQKPQLAYLGEETANTEQTVLSGLPLLQMSSRATAVDGQTSQYKFTGTIDTKNLNMGTKSEVTVRVLVLALSPTRKYSASQVVEVTVKKPAAAPAPVAAAPAAPAPAAAQAAPAAAPAAAAPAAAAPSTSVEGN